MSSSAARAPPKATISARCGSKGSNGSPLFQSDEERDRLAGLSKEMIEQAATLRNKVLKIPLLTLIQAGDAAVDFHDKMANAWAQPWLDQVIRRSSPSSSTISSPASSRAERQIRRGRSF